MQREWHTKDLKVMTTLLPYGSSTQSMMGSPTIPIIKFLRSGKSRHMMDLSQKFIFAVGSG